MSEPEIIVPLKFWHPEEHDLFIEKQRGEDGLLRYICVKPYKTIDGKIEKEQPKLP
jgi:hypothetical protein